MENQKNNKGVIILLSVIIVILSVLCILFATGTISLKNNTNEVDNNGNNAEEIAMNVMPTIVSFMNQQNGLYTYCGNITNSNMASYNQSTSYKSLQDLKSYLNNIMTKELFDKYFLTENDRYIEKDNKLYCMYLPADGLYINFITENSINKLDNLNYLVSNETNDSFDVTMTFTYTSSIEMVTNEKHEFKASFIKENGRWMVNSIEKNDVTFLDSLVGVWGYNDYVIEIKKYENDYVYSQGQYATDGVIGGVIKNHKEVSKNKYELEVFVEGCSGNNCMEEKEDETNYVLIEIDDSKNVIINNNNEYELITKDNTEYDKINKFFNN